MEEGEKDWKTLLPDIVKALNEAPTDALQGRSADDIDDVAAFDLQNINAAKAEQSEETIGSQEKDCSLRSCAAHDW